MNTDYALNVSVKFNNNDAYMPFNNSINDSTKYTAERLQHCGFKVPIIIKKDVSILCGRAVAVIEKDTIPIRDEHVFVSTGVTKTNSNGYFTLRTPYNRSDKKPMLSREGLKLREEKKTSDGYLLVYELSDSVQSFRQECDSIHRYYEMAKKSTPSKNYHYRYNCKNDPKQKVELFYTKPDDNGYSRGYFYLATDDEKKKHWRYFLGDGTLDLGYDGKGLRSLIFKGKDAIGNTATLRFLIIDNYLYVYLYLSEKEQIFIQKIEGASKNQGRNDELLP